MSVWSSNVTNLLTQSLATRIKILMTTTVCSNFERTKSGLIDTAADKKCRDHSGKKVKCEDVPKPPAEDGV